jgi:glycosyltransferase involved in cell wall biosynthesis
MKILHIVGHVRDIGNGFVHAAVDLACTQAKLNHEVGIISSGGDYEMLLESHNVQNFIRKEQGQKPFHHINAAKRYWQIFKEFQPDIVHAHLPRETLLAYMLKWKFGYTLISTVHNEFQHRAILTGFADRVIAVSEAVAQLMAQRGIPEEKLRVVLNGTLDSPRARSLQNYSPAKLHHPAIATVGRMIKRKGIAELIEAFAKIASDFPEAHLYLIGDGPERDCFETQVQNAGLAHRIHFEGFQSEPQRYLLSTDIFVLASHREPFGLVLSEAREVGCAIVASNVDGIPEVLDDGKAGILVPPKDSQTLAKTLGKLLRDPELLDACRQSSQRNTDWLNINRVAKETLAVYDE